MEKHLYIVKAEVKGLPNSQLIKENIGTGAFLFAFVMVSDALEAGSVVKRSLEEDYYKVIRIEEIFKEESYDFSDNDHKEVIQEARSSKEVVYGIFYPHDEE